MKVHEVMTTAVVTTTPGASLKDAALVLAENRISGMPVVDDDGVVLGVLSEADVLAKESAAHEGHRGFMHWLLDPTDPWLESRFSARTVGEAMSTPAEVIGPDSALPEAATRMLEGEINRLPVVSAEGKLVGLVSRGDLVRAFARTDAEILREIEEDLLGGAVWDSFREVLIFTGRGNTGTWAFKRCSRKAFSFAGATSQIHRVCVSL